MAGIVDFDVLVLMVVAVLIVLMTMMMVLLVLLVMMMMMLMAMMVMRSKAMNAVVVWFRRWRVQPLSPLIVQTPTLLGLGPRLRMKSRLWLRPTPGWL